MEIFLLIVIAAIATAVWWYKKNEPWEFLQNAKVVEKTEGRDLDHEKITGLMFGDGIDGVGYVIPPGSLGGGEELNRDVTRPTFLWRLRCEDGLEDVVPSSKFHEDIILDILGVGSEVVVSCRKGILGGVYIKQVERIISRETE